MSKYSTLDAHSRNCPSCIRQRELDMPEDHGEHIQGKKKLSLQIEKRKLSESKSSLVRRSNSSLSYSDVGNLKKEGSFEGSTYLTPTQRKNQEIKRIRLELAKANELLQVKDKELALLRKEVSALRESKNPSDSWTGETSSMADSGNCEESCSNSWDPDQEDHGTTAESGNKLENIDFELMETALKEEEETRHKLEAGNEELRDQLMDVRRELGFREEQFEEEASDLKKKYEDQILDIRKENSEKIEQLVNELAESSLRCARQQEAIEQKQLKIDDILTELSTCKDELSKAEEKIQTNEETLAKVKSDIDEKTKYLNQVADKPDRPLVNHSYSQTDHEISEGSSKEAECPVNLFSPNEMQEISLVYPRKEEESICDNKIHYTYQFLKRSIYYFLTDKENSGYHLKSIQRLLEFNDVEQSAITKSKLPIIKKY